MLISKLIYEETKNTFFNSAPFIVEEALITASWLLHLSRLYLD